MQEVLSVEFLPRAKHRAGPMSLLKVISVLLTGVDSMRGG